MTKGKAKRNAVVDTTSDAARSNGGGDTAPVIVGNVPSGKRMPVILFSVVWVAWIVFLVGMMVM